MNEHVCVIDEGTAMVCQPRLSDLLSSCSALPPLQVAVVNPVDDVSILAITEMARRHLVEPVLIGPASQIRAASAATGIDLEVGWPIINASSPAQSAEIAATMAGDGRVHAIMKGALHTDVLLAPVLCSESSLKSGRRLSHVFVIDAPDYHKLLMITDAVVAIAPDLAEKAAICQNAIDFFHAIRGELVVPKIAVLAAVETVNTRMPATMDAACLCKMAERGQIKGGILDGPLALDNAISSDAVKKKGIVSPVAGDADILVAPDIEAANIMAKIMTFACNAEAGGIVVGARVPIILTSRADTVGTRLNSCALALLVREKWKSSCP